MEINRIKDLMKSLEPQPVEVKNKYSILIPLIEVDNELSLLYEVRSKKLRNQPGEICFPGGKIEPGETVIEAAVRETAEELLISEEDIEVFAQGDFLVNPYSSILYSTIAYLKKDYKEIVPSSDEVDHIFSVPLKFLIEESPKSYEMELSVKKNKLFPYELIPGGENYKFKRGRDNVLFYEYKGRVIWGFTAKMTYNFVKKIKNM